MNKTTQDLVDLLAARMQNLSAHEKIHILNVLQKKSDSDRMQYGEGIEIPFYSCNNETGFMGVRWEKRDNLCVDHMHVDFSQNGKTSHNISLGDIEIYIERGLWNVMLWGDKGSAVNMVLVIEDGQKVWRTYHQVYGEAS